KKEKKKKKDHHHHEEREEKKDTSVVTGASSATDRPSPSNNVPSSTASAAANLVALTESFANFGVSDSSASGGLIASPPITSSSPFPSQSPGVGVDNKGGHTKNSDGLSSTNDGSGLGDLGLGSASEADRKVQAAKAAIAALYSNNTSSSFGFPQPSSSFGLSPDPSAASLSGLGTAAASSSDNTLLQSSFFGQPTPPPPTFPSAGITTARSVSTSTGGWPTTNANSSATSGVSTPGGWPAWPTTATGVNTPDEQKRNTSMGQDLFACAPPVAGAGGSGFFGSPSTSGVVSSGPFSNVPATTAMAPSGGGGGSGLLGGGTYGVNGSAGSVTGATASAAGRGRGQGCFGMVGGTGGATGVTSGGTGSISMKLEDITPTKIDISASTNTGNANAFSSLNALDAFALAGKVQAASSSVSQKQQETDDSEKKSLSKEDGTKDSSRLDSFGFDNTLSAPWGSGGSTAPSTQNLPPAGGNASFGFSTSSSTSNKAPLTEEFLLI
ncbi:hypothetical protein CSUI_009205, partial [Cystoisospora suis]